jgi:hypothetical protein
MGRLPDLSYRVCGKRVALPMSGCKIRGGVSVASLCRLVLMTVGMVRNRFRGRVEGRWHTCDSVGRMTRSREKDGMGEDSQAIGNLMS